MKQHLLVLSVFLIAFSSQAFAQEKQIYPTLKKQYYYLNNSSPYPEEVLTALYTKFDNKNFEGERSKMTKAQANLILWNAVANITSYTNPLNQLIRYQNQEEEIINLYNQLGYSSEHKECIRMLFKSARQADSLQLNQYTWDSPNCFYSQSYDSLIVQYIDKHLDELVRDENGMPINKSFTGEYSFYDRANFGYVKLNMNKGHKVTAERYNDNLKLQKLEWYYPSGSLRFQLIFSESGNKSYETHYYPTVESIKREVIYNEDGLFSSVINYDQTGNVSDEKYYAPNGKLELSYGFVQLKDGSSVYAPLEAYDLKGKSTFTNGNGYLDVYSYEKENRKLLVHQEFKDWRLEGKVIDFDTKTGKVERVFKSGQLASMTEYYKSGELKRQIEFMGGEVSKTTNYPKFKDYTIEIENVSPKEMWFTTYNAETTEEMNADHKLECLNCEEVLVGIFSKSWVENNLELFENEYYEYTVVLNINGAKEVYGINLYPLSDYPGLEEEAFQTDAINKLTAIRINNYPPNDQNRYVAMNTNFRVKLIKIQ